MRKVNYEVVKANGERFFTTSYVEATGNGNRIANTLLKKVDEKTPAQKAYAKKRAGIIKELLLGH